MTDFRKLCPILFQGEWDYADMDALHEEYRCLRENAPSRNLRGKKYFVDHYGIPSAVDDSDRYEEHCAIALVNLKRKWENPLGGNFCFLDYQVPLKAQQSDYGVGKIDLVGITDKGRLILTELKVESKQGKSGASPRSALLQGLRYAAIVEKNLPAIIDEARSRYKKTVQQIPPIVQLLAPEGWWRQQGFDFTTPGDAQRRFADLIDGVEDKIPITVECLAFDRLKVKVGLNGNKPELDPIPTLQAVPLR